MRYAVASIVFGILASSSLAANPTHESSTAVPPSYPTPLHMSIIGLSITAIAVIGARASRRSSDTMMYMVLASLAVTAVLVAYADKVHSDYMRERIDQLQQLAKPGS